MVEARGFEPLTPAMRTQCSPAELRPPNGTKDYIGSGEAREQTMFAYSTSGQSSIWTFSLAPSSATGISSGTIARPFA